MRTLISGFLDSSFYRVAGKEPESMRSWSTIAPFNAPIVAGILVAKSPCRWQPTQRISPTAKIGRAVDALIILNHYKCPLSENLGRSTETLYLIESDGTTQRVAVDIHAYAANAAALMATTRNSPTSAARKAR
jgi:hypothetical protein